MKKILLPFFTLLIFVTPHFVFANPTFDTKAIGNSTSASKSLAVTVANQQNRFMIAYITSGDGSATEPTNVQFNGIAMNVLAQCCPLQRHDVYYLANPDIGTHNFTFTTGAGGTDGNVYTVYVYYDTDTTVDNYVLSATTGSASLTPTKDNCLIFGVAVNNNQGTLSGLSGIPNNQNSASGVGLYFRAGDNGIISPASLQTVSHTEGGSKTTFISSICPPPSTLLSSILSLVRSFWIF